MTVVRLLLENLTGIAGMYDWLAGFNLPQSWGLAQTHHFSYQCFHNPCPRIAWKLRGDDGRNFPNPLAVIKSWNFQERRQEMLFTPKSGTGSQSSQLSGTLILATKKEVGLGKENYHEYLIQMFLFLLCPAGEICPHFLTYRCNRKWEEMSPK